MLIEFIRHPFGMLWSLCAAGLVGWMSWNLWKRRQRGLFRQPPDEPVFYDEKMVSGRSLKTWYTSLGRARNCLRLVVTSKELWITPVFPFSALAAPFDLDHRITLDRISSAKLRSSAFQRSLRITYRDQGGARNIVEVSPPDLDVFITILRARGVAVDAR